jgi:hypothetical protein
LHHHLAKPLELGSEPTPHHKNEMKIGVVIMPRRSAAGLELLDRLPDGAADAAAGRFSKAEVAIFQKRA